MVNTIRRSGTEATLNGFFNDSRCNQSGRSNGSIEVYFQQEPSVRLRHTPGQVSLCTTQCRTIPSFGLHPIFQVSLPTMEFCISQPLIQETKNRLGRRWPASDRISECVVPTVCRKVERNLPTDGRVGKKCVSSSPSSKCRDRTTANVTPGFVNGQHTSDIGNWHTMRQLPRTCTVWPM